MKRMIRKSFYVTMLMLFTTIQYTCNEDPLIDFIPQVFVEETINLNNFEYNRLNNLGGFVYISGGVRGIIIYRKSTSEYLAFERNCSFQPLDECAQVKIDESTLFMIDTCCSSTFNFDGLPTGGPAEIPLRQYMTFLNQNLLTVTSDFN